MAIAPKGDIAVLAENALVVYAAQGGVIESFTVNQPRGLTLDAEGRPVVITERGLMRARAQLVTLRAGDAATGRPLEELAAVGILSNGDIIAADRRTRAIHRFDAEGQPRGAFAAVNASRLAVNERDDIAAIEREGKSIVLLDAAGTIVRRIPPRGEGYTLAEPADVAIDAIGHIYVLDRDQAAVFVFTKDGRLLAIAAFARSGRVRLPPALVDRPRSRRPPLHPRRTPAHRGDLPMTATTITLALALGVALTSTPRVRDVRDAGVASCDVRCRWAYRE